ncbi:hypothetical protein [Euzebya rosea]|uniref:hypothetical protein n=1 Tax=Euzebya rosea TaxID=2052804 RepID=UPI000D3EC598|nr:hypothetical protein [Euzebya rosea]
MTNAMRFPAILALSVVFGMPALRDMMARPETLFESGVAYAAAFALAWAGVTGVTRLVEHYAHSNALAQHRDDAAEVERELLEIREREMAATASGRMSDGGPMGTMPPHVEPVDAAVAS